MRALAKAALAFLLGDYEVYRIFRLDLAAAAEPDPGALAAAGYALREVSPDEVAAAADPEIRGRAFYGGDGAFGFAALEGGEIVCLQWIWHGARYRTRNFWPLAPDEAKSVELYTRPEARGKGLATALKEHSAAAMRAKGFRALYSRIWLTNRPSVRVSEKAGWRQVALVALVRPLGLGPRRRLVLRTRRRGPRLSREAPARQRAPGAGPPARRRPARR